MKKKKKQSLGAHNVYVKVWSSYLDRNENNGMNAFDGTENKSQLSKCSMNHTAKTKALKVNFYFQK